MGTPPVETYRRSNTAWRLHRKFGAHRGGAHNGTYARRIHGAILNLVCSLFCQGACGLGGQDWVGPHREVGRLVLGHTAQGVLVGGSRQVIIRTASNDASAGYLARLPPRSYVVSIILLYSIKGKGWFTPPHSCGRSQAELASAARLDDPTVGPRRATPPQSWHPAGYAWIGLGSVGVCCYDVGGPGALSAASWSSG